jgi:hypothetical protein
MVAWNQVNRADVLRAIKEYDRSGPERFFSEHVSLPPRLMSSRGKDAVIRRKQSCTAYEFATGERLGSGDFEGGKSGAVEYDFYR